MTIIAGWSDQNIPIDTNVVTMNEVRKDTTEVDPKSVTATIDDPITRIDTIEVAVTVVEVVVVAVVVVTVIVDLMAQNGQIRNTTEIEIGTIADPAQTVRSDTEQAAIKVVSLMILALQ